MTCLPLRVRPIEGDALLVNDTGRFFRASPAFLDRLTHEALDAEDMSFLLPEGHVIEEGDELGSAAHAYPPLFRFVDLSELDANLHIVPQTPYDLTIEDDRFEVWAWKDVDHKKESMWKSGAVQAAERYYHTLFLVRTLYSPKTHNLNRLRTLGEDMEPRLKDIWPTETKFEKRCYELIRAAYVKAGYSRHYRITREELAWLEDRVGRLRDLIREVSPSRIEELAAAA